MREHVTILGVFHIVLGSLGLLGALVVLLLFGGSAGVIGVIATRKDPDAAIAIPIVGAIGIGLFLFLLILSIPGLVSGIGLLKHRPWARILGIVCSGLNLVNFPLGTAVGAYTLWALLQRDAEALFTSAKYA